MDGRGLLEKVKEVVPGFHRDFTAIKDKLQNISPWRDEAHRRIWAEETVGDRLFKDPLFWNEAKF